MTLTLDEDLLVRQFRTGSWLEWEQTNLISQQFYFFEARESDWIEDQLNFTVLEEGLKDSLPGVASFFPLVLDPEASHLFPEGRVPTVAPSLRNQLLVQIGENSPSGKNKNPLRELLLLKAAYNFHYDAGYTRLEPPRLVVSAESRQFHHSVPKRAKDLLSRMRNSSEFQNLATLPYLFPGELLLQEGKIRSNISNVANGITR